MEKLFLILVAALSLTNTIDAMQTMSSQLSDKNLASSKALELETDIKNTIKQTLNLYLKGFALNRFNTPSKDFTMAARNKSLEIIRKTALTKLAAQGFSQQEAQQKFDAWAQAEWPVQ